MRLPWGPAQDFNRRLREEQDAAFQQSLAADRERERQREAQRQAAEAAEAAAAQAVAAVKCVIQGFLGFQVLGHGVSPLACL